MRIVDYSKGYEKDWLLCRLIAFLDTQYFDDVCTEKPSFQTEQSIEIVAVEGEKLVGILDAEYHAPESSQPYYEISTIAVLPERQNSGVGNLLFTRLKQRALNNRVKRIEAWTREDHIANQWYLKMGFVKFEEYWHLYTSELPAGCAKSLPESLDAVFTFWHYSGNDPESLGVDIQDKFRCRGYEIVLRE